MKWLRYMFGEFQQFIRECWIPVLLITVMIELVENWRYIWAWINAR